MFQKNFHQLFVTISGSNMQWSALVLDKMKKQNSKTFVCYLNFHIANNHPDNEFTAADHVKNVQL